MANRYAPTVDDAETAVFTRGNFAWAVVALVLWFVCQCYGPYVVVLCPVCLLNGARKCFGHVKSVITCILRSLSVVSHANLACVFR